MNPLIEKAIYYIEKNLDEPLCLEEIAKVSGYSSFHFSRIFKQSTGESVFSMIKRLRVMQGARDLVHKNSSITMIGIETGYETSTSFNKAFKQKFQMSPTEYKKRTLKDLHRFQKDLKGVPQIVKRDEIVTISTRETGDLHIAPVDAWSRIFETFSCKETKTIGLIFDNPEITEVEKIRYEACIENSEVINELPVGFNRKIIPQGEYVTYIHKGSLEELYDVSLQFYGWIIKKGLKIALFPLIENYLDNPRDLISKKVTTPTVELCILLEK